MRTLPLLRTFLLGTLLAMAPAYAQAYDPNLQYTYTVQKRTANENGCAGTITQFVNKLDTGEQVETNPILWIMPVDGYTVLPGSYVPMISRVQFVCTPHSIELKMITYPFEPD